MPNTYTVKDTVLHTLLLGSWWCHSYSAACSTQGARNVLHADLSLRVVFLQLCLPPVRMPRGLNLFKSEYERADYDLEKWRSSCRWLTKRDTVVLDAEDGAGAVA